MRTVNTSRDGLREEEHGAFISTLRCKESVAMWQGKSARGNIVWLSTRQYGRHAYHDEA